MINKAALSGVLALSALLLVGTSVATEGPNLSETGRTPLTDHPDWIVPQLGSQDSSTKKETELRDYCLPGLQVGSSPRKKESGSGLLEKIQDSPWRDRTCIALLATAIAGCVKLSLNKASLNWSATQEKCVGPLFAGIVGLGITYRWQGDLYSNLDRKPSHEYFGSAVLAGGLYYTLRELLHYYTGK